MKNLVSDDELIEALLKGSEKLSNTVGATLGPNGKNVILKDRGNNAVVTKDGVTVAKFFELEDPVENLACEIIKQSAIETCNRAGDGTTTSTILANAIFGEAIKKINSLKAQNKDIPLIDIKTSIEEAAEQVKEFIESKSTQLSSKEQIKHVATISANGDEVIGNIIADAADTVGKAGSITVEKSGENETILDFVEGFTINVGYRAGAFVNEKRLNLAKLENPLVLVTDLTINDYNMQEFTKLFAKVDKEKRPFVIVADEVADKPLALLIMNAIKGAPVLVVKPPRYGQERRQIMEDLSIALGARFIQKARGDKLSTIRMEDLGTCKTVECGANQTIFVAGVGSLENVSERIEQIQSEMQQIKDMDASVRLQERITRLSAGIAVIKVGGTTQIEVEERKYRIEDALEAVKSAKEKGIVPGGATVFRQASEYIASEEVTIGKEILSEALLVPFKKLWDSTFVEDFESDAPLSESFGYNFRTKEPVINLIEEGVIDPAKVLESALENAVSAATTLILANSAIIEE